MAKEREQPPVHQPPNIFPVPVVYSTFMYNATALAPTAVARRRGLMMRYVGSTEDLTILIFYDANIIGSRFFDSFHCDSPLLMLNS